MATKSLKIIQSRLNLDKNLTMILKTSITLFTNE